MVRRVTLFRSRSGPVRRSLPFDHVYLETVENLERLVQRRPTLRSRKGFAIRVKRLLQLAQLIASRSWETPHENHAEASGRQSPPESWASLASTLLRCGHRWTPWQKRFLIDMSSPSKRYPSERQIEQLLELDTKAWL